MTKVTNIYIDTTGFTDEQYAVADKTIGELKTGNKRRWEGVHYPDEKNYAVLTLDCDGDRGYYDSVEQMRKSPHSCKCQPVSPSDLVKMKMRAKYGEPLDLSGLKMMITGKLAEAVGQPIEVIEGITPEREEVVVSEMASGLYSAGIVSLEAYRAVKNAIHIYAKG